MMNSTLTELTNNELAKVNFFTTRTAKRPKKNLTDGKKT